MKQTQRNYWLDCGLLITLLLITFTGVYLGLFISHPGAAAIWGLHRSSWLAAHIGCGLTFIAGMTLHTIWHRKWLKALRRRPLASLPSKLRANRMTDRFAWMTFLAVAGLGGLDWLASGLGSGPSFFGRLHVAFGTAMLIAIGIHLALHRRWIVSTSRFCLNFGKTSWDLYDQAVRNRPPLNR